MPPLPEAIIRVLAPFAPLFSPRVWPHAQILLLGAIPAPGPRTVTAALRAIGVTDCNGNGSGLQSTEIWDYIMCISPTPQDRIPCI